MQLFVILKLCVCTTFLIDSQSSTSFYNYKNNSTSEKPTLQFIMLNRVFPSYMGFLLFKGEYKKKMKKQTKSRQKNN